MIPLYIFHEYWIHMNSLEWVVYERIMIILYIYIYIRIYISLKLHNCSLSLFKRLSHRKWFLNFLFYFPGLLSYYQNELITAK